MSADPATLRAEPAPAQAAAAIRLRGVEKTYPTARGHEAPAVRDLSFDVAPGEFVCLVGPSGSGKTTTLNLIAGLDRPTRGEVEAGGRPITGPGPDRAVLFQESALFPWMSVRENVEFALELTGVAKPERRERAEAWLSKVRLAKVADRQPHELSAGMRQRAALARALSCEPDVLLADEPFAALDAQTRDIMQVELQRVWTETGNTFFFVTHNIREAVFLADRILVMSAAPGTLVEEHRIVAPRPRQLEDVLVPKVVADIHTRLLREVEEAELGDA
jgi:NitT/TauT family transport system ATP-binding protein